MIWFRKVTQQTNAFPPKGSRNAGNKECNHRSRFIYPLSLHHLSCTSKTELTPSGTNSQDIYGKSYVQPNQMESREHSARQESRCFIIIPASFLVTSQLYWDYLVPMHEQYGFALCRDTCLSRCLLGRYTGSLSPGIFMMPWCCSSISVLMINKGSEHQNNCNHNFHSHIQHQRGCYGALSISVWDCVWLLDGCQPSLLGGPICRGRSCSLSALLWGGHMAGRGATGTKQVWWQTPYVVLSTSRALCKMQREKILSYLLTARAVSLQLKLKGPGVWRGIWGTSGGTRGWRLRKISPREWMGTGTSCLWRWWSDWLWRYSRKGQNSVLRDMVNELYCW